MYIHTYRHAHTHTLTHTLSQQSTTHRTHHHTNAISISWQQRTTALHTDPITTHTLIRYIYTHTLPTTTRRQEQTPPPALHPPLLALAPGTQPAVSTQGPAASPTLSPTDPVPRAY